MVPLVCITPLIVVSLAGIVTFWWWFLELTLLFPWQVFSDCGSHHRYHCLIMVPMAGVILWLWFPWQVSLFDCGSHGGIILWLWFLWRTFSDCGSHERLHSLIGSHGKYHFVIVVPMAAVILWLWFPWQASLLSDGGSHDRHPYSPIAHAVIATCDCQNLVHTGQKQLFCLTDWQWPSQLWPMWKSMQVSKDQSLSHCHNEKM